MWREQYAILRCRFAPSGVQFGLSAVTFFEQTFMSDIVPLPEPLQEAIIKYESWINEELKNTQNVNKITQPICHYTNSNGLKGIMDNNEIWFTDIRHLNDPSEFLFGCDLLKI